MRQDFVLLFIIAPLFLAVGTALLGRTVKQLGFMLSCACGLILCFCSFMVFGLLQKTPAHIFIYKVGGHLPPFGIALVFDGLSSFMLILVNFISLLVALYSFRYMDRYTDKWKFYCLFMFMLAGMNGLIISGDLFTLYVFLEVASVAGYALVAFGTEAEDLEAAFKYAVMGVVASIFILLGIALLYSYTSTLNMADMAFVLATKPQGALVAFVSVLFLAGFGLKSAMVPFHAWLPDAHPSAPAPISALLSGVFIKTLGVYALARVFFNVLGVSQKALFIMMFLGTVSMVVGAVLAISQRDIKRMLAYSSISQVGYIIFALGLGTPLGILGALFHLFNHAISKTMLFLNSGAIEYSTDTRNMEKLGGLNSRLPVTGSTSFIGGLSISGVPPLGGFWSKLIIILAAVQAGHFIFALIAVLVSIVTLGYYLKFQRFVFLGKLNLGLSKIRGIPLSMTIPVVILAAISIVSVLLLMPFAGHFLDSACNALIAGNLYKDSFWSAIIW
ncbi:MAG: NADH/ubiquinone/plastoquinone (complex I) [Candidatus Omnitrophica bacterium]|nr:NADH/ubiquinone/plastoquinone (complex I) [Candidatus Omnitrophota bacterium]MBU1869319.1 NADH/ubiquinone/plastoquinone (complex I) [Candidatus Omnitrophota bacterium]